MTMNLENHTTTTELQNHAQNLYNHAEEKNLHRKHGARRVQEATLKIAARQKQQPLNNETELEYYSRPGLDKRARKIAKELGEYAPPYKPQVYLHRFKEDEEITNTQLEKAEEILDELENNQQLVGKSPSAKAAAAVYIAGILEENYLPNHRIVQSAKTSEPTLRKVYNIMVEELDIIDEFLDMHPYPTRTKWGGQ